MNNPNIFWKFSIGHGFYADGSIIREPGSDYIKGTSLYVKILELNLSLGCVFT